MFTPTQANRSDKDFRPFLKYFPKFATYPLLFNSKHHQNSNPQMLSFSHAPALLFWIPMGVAAALWLLSLLGLFGDHDADFDFDADVDGDIHLHLWDMGKIPLMLILTLLLFSFGAIGLGLMWLVALLLPSLAGWTLAITAAVLAIVPAVLLSALISRKLQPLFQDYGVAIKSHELVGQFAITDSSQINQQFGSAYWTDKLGNHIQISVRTFPDKPPIPNGKKVILVSYDAEKNLFFVEEL